MTQKLVRNTSNERWRTYWEAVDAAASKAPTLRFQEKKGADETRRKGTTSREAAKPKGK